jgi:hypothetical protein
MSTILIFASSAILAYETSTLNTAEYGRLRVVDLLDVKSEKSEAEHGYFAEKQVWAGNALLPYETGAYYTDDGRANKGREGFAANTLPGMDHILVKRTDLSSADQSVDVFADGALVGRWHQSPGIAGAGRHFGDALTVMPGNRISADRTNLEFRYVSGGMGVYSFRYWVCVKDDGWGWVAAKATTYTLLAISAAAAVFHAYRILGKVSFSEAALRGLLPWAASLLIVMAAYGAKYAAALAVVYAVIRKRRPFAEKLLGYLLSERRLVPLIFLSVYAAVNMISAFAMMHYPLGNDEWSYLYEAKLYTMGVIYMPPPSMPEFMWLDHFVNDGKFYSRYTPGHTITLAVGVLAGSPWMIPPLISALTAVCIYYIGKEMYDDPRVGAVAGVLCATSPFFLLTSSTLLSHVSELFYLTVFTLFFVRSVKSPGASNPAIAGFSLGMAVLTRPLTATAYSAPFLAYAFLRVIISASNGDSGKAISLRFDTGFFKRTALMAAAVMLMCEVQLAYNLVLTGNPLTYTYFLPLRNPDEIPSYKLDSGCASGPYRDCLIETLLSRYDYVKGRVQVMLDTYMGWPTIAHLPLILIVFLTLDFRKWDVLLAASATLIVAAYAFYYFPGPGWTGPAFFYEGIGSLLILSAGGVVRIYRLIEYSEKKAEYSTLFTVLLILTAASGYDSLYENGWGRCGSLNGRCGISELAAMNRERTDIFAKAESLVAGRAVVFARSAAPYLTERTEYVAGANSPLMDDRILYAPDRGADKDRRFMARFPDRSCFIYDYNGGQSTITPCDFQD